MKILVIEDNPTNMKLATDLLRKSGYEVLTAPEADTGIALARQELPPLILMDIQLPGMDGLTATRL
jgi:two-component system, cell cycle response regulator DivK